jgi:hypothetical protein
MQLDDRELIARTLQAEAGNQGLGGMLAVGSVIKNRMGSGQSFRDVILAPAQFSAWNKFTGAAGGEQGQDMSKVKPSEDAYAAADALISGNIADITGGATHYYNPDISNPNWGASAGGDWTKIGSHVFGKAGNFRTGATDMIGAQAPQQMAQQEQPRGLLGGMIDRDFADQLYMAALAGSPNAQRFQPLIQQVAAGQETRRQEKKQQKNINKTIDYFQKKADAGDDLAASLLGAMQTNAIDPASAINTYISESTAVAKDSRSTSEKDYDRAVAGGYEGSFMDFLQAKKKDFNVDINTAGADDFSKALMKEMAKRYETYQTEADAAERTMNNLSLMDSIAQQDDFYSGFGADTLLRVRRAAVAFGADPDLVSDAETFNKIAKDSALQVMGGSLGVGFSNADREFVEAMVPNISNTVEGNRKIIAVQKKLQQRKIQLARLAEQYVDDNGTLKGFRGFIMDWSEENPLFSSQEKVTLDASATAKSVGLSKDALSFIE